MRSDIQFIQQPEIDVHHYERGDTVRLTTANLRHEYQLDVYILRRDDRFTARSSRRRPRPISRSPAGR